MAIKHSACPRRGGSLGQRPGFSLLELMVALTILAIALVPVAYFYTKSLQVAEQAGIRTRALALARERMTELRALPYEMLLPNIRPVEQQKLVFGPNGQGLFDFQGDVYGYDFANPGANALHPAGQWAGMFRYPLPLDFNPYNPDSMGYNNAPNANHFVANSPNGDPQVNLNATVGNFNGGYDPLDYEYEPIGFYYQVTQRNNSLSPSVPGAPYLPDAQDVRMADSRSVSTVEPAVAGGADRFRTGYEQQVDNYSIYGRRTIIMDLYPPTLTGLGSPVQDTDGNPGTTGDIYSPDSDFDGGATVVDPYPINKGPDNKFEMVSRFGKGKLIIVQVFWLPRNAPEAYVEWEDLNKIELKAFVAPGGQITEINASSGTTGTDPNLRMGLNSSAYVISPATITP